MGNFCSGYLRCSTPRKEELYYDLYKFDISSRDSETHIDKYAAFDNV